MTAREISADAPGEEPAARLREGLPAMFRSADGTMRCIGCHLLADMCTCRADHPAREILSAVLGRHHG